MQIFPAVAASLARNSLTGIYYWKISKDPKRKVQSIFFKEGTRQQCCGLWGGKDSMRRKSFGKIEVREETKRMESK